MASDDLIICGATFGKGDIKKDITTKLVKDIKDNKIYSLSIRTIPNTIKLNVKKVSNVTLYLQDSYLMLPLSFRQLSSEFNVQSKGYFPYPFVNSSNLNYVGPTPPSHFFADLPSPDLYNLLSVPSWNLKFESIKYLKGDLESLYQVVKFFGDNLFGSYGLDIKNYLTLPSLAFAIFRSRFFNNAHSKIPIINKSSRFKFVNESYFGGSVDLIKPKHSDVYCYDVNSLYPFALLQTMPVGDGVYSTDPNISNWFGFIKVQVTCPSSVTKPILPFRRADGVVIHPVGTWVGTEVRSL